MGFYMPINTFFEGTKKVFYARIFWGLFVIACYMLRKNSNAI